ncbi:G-type lectin S-receptor-like serine/threonine-protein kinase B120 [Curcuma longa]|uniref:G-type lectin S-receptor-like serine/threonine-protein kinase B120 n=1 Tax=Curcuma longa TaxID=136217 RepID=UPI003D9E8FF0
MAAAWLLSLAIVVLLPLISQAADTINPGEFLRDGDRLISPGSIFELGFFRPGQSSSRYVGIWYHDFSTDTVLWVANRREPVLDDGGAFGIASDGNLVVLDAANRTLWSSGAALSSNNSVVQLTDSGNLLLNDSGGVRWQSFDHPSDTYMPGMKVGLDLRTGQNQYITSWTSENDPAPGNFSLSMDPRGSTQIFMWEGDRLRWRSGRWNQQVFIGVQNMVPQYIYGFRLNDFVREQRMYFYYEQFNSSHRYVLSWDGVEKHMIWRNDTSEWVQYWAQPVTACDIYNTCGKNARCTDESSPICSCLAGFQPASGDEWDAGNWSSGCVRKTALGCSAAGSGGDGFIQLEGTKLPDLSDWIPDVLDAPSCSDRCLRNCSCTAYAYVTGIGCLTWGVDLLDVQMFSGGGGEDLFIRLAGSELTTNKTRTRTIIIAVIVVLLVLVSLGSLFLLWKCRRRIQEPVLTYSSFGGAASVSDSIRITDESNEEELSELQLWSFDSVLFATKEFSDSELIGEGGFGPVYKGTSFDGQELAVKRLSRSSGQGIEEFKNEVKLISKLQHRNLVRLLGCCIHEQEKILIYEYMPNKSLDVFLFDSTKNTILDWNTRYAIVEGIARGLVYLHRDSRLRIIHRDLKASNILLDKEMNPKISDFGMARIFGNDDETSTKRVVGTFGYMAPEYAMQGYFSSKSDVYSFGVLALEILSGKRNNSYHHPEWSLNLITLAWKLWNEGRVMEFIDPVIKESANSTSLKSSVTKCLNLALLCLQDQPNDRPSMASVVVMLESDTVVPAPPRQPTFTTDRSFCETEDSSTVELKAISSSGVSITMLTGR